MNQTAHQLHDAIIREQSVCLRQLGKIRAGEVRYGRWLHNDKVRVDKLIDTICQDINDRSAGRHLLLIQDTSELNYATHQKRKSGLGTVGNGKDQGMYIHPVLCIDAQHHQCLGLAHLHLWQRHKRKAANYRRQPVEDKESHRWVDSIRHARERLTQAASLTVIADRESDLYALWDRLPDPRTHLLIRASRDRNLDHEGQRLFAWLHALPIQGQHHLALPARSGGRSARNITLDIRYGHTHIRRPIHNTDPESQPRIGLWAIEAREKNTDQSGEPPICWRLLTTHPVTSLTDAQRCLHWYSQRWHIEQSFRILKKQGLDIESSLVEAAGHLEKLVVLAVSAAVHTLQLTLARSGQSDRPATDCFDAPQQQLLQQLNPTLEGKTAKQHNPHPGGSLAWAAWIIARLGGWKGYASERPPGPITMLRGLEAFAKMEAGFRLALGLMTGEEGEDVCIR